MSRLDRDTVVGPGATDCIADVARSANTLKNRQHNIA
jgi:hypothetical protein